MSTFTTTEATVFSRYSYNESDVTTANMTNTDFACYEVEIQSPGVMTSFVLFIIVSTLCLIVGKF